MLALYSTGGVGAANPLNCRLLFNAAQVISAVVDNCCRVNLTFANAVQLQASTLCRKHNLSPL